MNQDKSIEKLHREVEAIDLMSRENPRSVVNLLPEKIREKVWEHFAAHPEYFNKPEGILRQQLKDNHKAPKKIDNVLRLKFWLEYDRVQAFGLKQLNLSVIMGGVVTKEFFHLWYFREVGHVAWLMCPPINYIACLEEAHYQNLEGLSQIANQDVVDEYGKFDHKTAELKIKLFKALDERLHGSIVQHHKVDQKIDQRTVQVNLDQKDARGITSLVEGSNMEVLQKRITELERQDRILSHLPGEQVREESGSQSVSTLDMTTKNVVVDD